MERLLAAWPNWLWAAATLTGAALVAIVIHYVVFKAVKRVAARTGSALDDSLVRHSQRPARIIFVLVAVLMTLSGLPLPTRAADSIRHVTGIGLILSVAWGVVALTQVFDDLVASKYPLDVPDNLAARQMQTRLDLLRRIVAAAVVIVAGSAILMTFPSIRHLGTSLLASAGLVGLVVGMAARPALSNLIAGVQLALTEPIRIDDVVIVEGEWGWIEEILTSYVVVRVWDLRRLVVPLTYFIEHPFQNWTRRTADILGTVFVYVDYKVPVEEVRNALRPILESSGKWDGKVWGLQVTNTSDRTMELRALMSAPDSGTAWDLRCYVREKLIEFLQQKYPESLPKARAEIQTLPAQSSRLSAPAS
jgi:small-conductance mechanosensitive channel